MTAPTTRPGARYAEELLRVECAQDGGDSPFGWFDGGELTPEGAGEGLCARLPASEST